MSLPTTVRWIGLAVLGLIIAATVALAASRLASQQIGIASESVSAGDSLAPPITSPPQARRERGDHSAAAGQTEGAATEARPPEAEGGPAGSTEAVKPVAPIEPTGTGQGAEPEPPAPEQTGSGDDGGGQGGGGRDD